MLVKDPITLNVNFAPLLLTNGSKDVNVMMNNPNRATVYPIRSRMKALYPEVNMLSVPLLRDGARVTLHAEMFEGNGNSVNHDAQAVTVEYRHYAPRSMVFYGTIAELIAVPVDLGRSASLRGRAGAIALSANVQNADMTVRISWRSGGEPIRTYEVILRGPGYVMIPEILTYE